MHKAKITDVRAYIVESGGADYHDQAQGHWIIDTPIANPMSVYEQYKASRTSWGINALGSVIVEVELNNGMTGVGVSTGASPPVSSSNDISSAFSLTSPPTMSNSSGTRCGARPCPMGARD